MREMFQSCRLPDQSKEWIDKISKRQVDKPPYKAVVENISLLQQEYKMARVDYSGLRVKLGTLKKPIKYETDAELVDLCKGMMQLAPGGIYATDAWVELDQSVDNVMAELESAVKEYNDLGLQD